MFLVYVREEISHEKQGCVDHQGCDDSLHRCATLLRIFPWILSHHVSHLFTLVGHRNKKSWQEKLSVSVKWSKKVFRRCLPQRLIEKDTLVLGETNSLREFRIFWIIWLVLSMRDRNSDGAHYTMLLLPELEAGLQCLLNIWFVQNFFLANKNLTCFLLFLTCFSKWRKTNKQEQNRTWHFMHCIVWHFWSNYHILTITMTSYVFAPRTSHALIFRAQSFIKRDANPTHAANATVTHTRRWSLTCRVFSMCIVRTCSR